MYINVYTYVSFIAPAMNNIFKWPMASGACLRSIKMWTKYCNGNYVYSGVCVDGWGFGRGCGGGGVEGYSLWVSSILPSLGKQIKEKGVDGGWLVLVMWILLEVGMPMLTRCQWQCLDRLSQIFGPLCKVCFYGWFSLENEVNVGNFCPGLNHWALLSVQFGCFNNKIIYFGK